MNINWYPGHMTKARRMMEDALKQVDAVCEVLDARIPASSQNPDLRNMAGGKPVLSILNRSDQADPDETRRWLTYLGGAVETSAGKPGGVKAVLPAVKALLSEKLERLAEKGQAGRAVKLMIAGIPNVGKSTLINSLAGGKLVKVEDRPGVTRGKQWISVGKNLLLLDTPGILWPKLESGDVGLNLAFTGAVRDEVVDQETLAAMLLERLSGKYLGRLAERYGIIPDESGMAMLERAAKKRGFLLPGALPDIERCSRTVLDEFRAGKLGRITLESSPC